MNLDDRYRHDPVFHQLVKGMLNLIYELKTTPSEIRDAAMFAQLKYELENPSTMGTLSPDLMAEIDRRLCRCTSD